MNPTASQPFRSLDDLVRRFHLILPKPRDEWRLVKDPLVGQVSGLPGFRGTTLATNGILVLLCNEADRVCIGHLQWFVPDQDEPNPELSDLWDGASVPPPRGAKPQLVKSLAFYCNL